MRCGPPLFFSLLLLTGCPGDPDPVDAGPDTDSGPGTDGGVDSSLPPTGDGNDSFADADPITVDGDPTRARIGEPGDQDFYTFDGTAGDWIVLFTQTEDPGDGSEFVDCVLQVFDGSMAMIAENDDAIPRGAVGTGTDSEIIIQLPETGIYYVMVQEFSQWSDMMLPNEGGLDYLYSLAVTSLDDSLDQINVETEMGTTPIVAGHTRGSEADFSLIAGSFADASDVDVYSFSIMFRRNTSFQLMPIGPMGHGSSTFPGRMWITNADGSEIIARIDDADMLDTINPPLPDAGDYQLHVEAPSTTGANPFYVLKSFRGPRDNPPEREEATNGDPTTPEVLTQTPDATVPEQREAFIRPDLPEADVDWYSFEVMAGENINVGCGSRTAGSGIEDLTATVFASTGTSSEPGMELAAATETATEGIAILDLVAAPGTYLLRLDRGAQISGVTGTWVRCGIVVAPPVPMP